MKHTIIILAILFAASCTKEPEPVKCPCSVTMLNAEQYKYKVTVTGGHSESFTVDPAKTVGFVLDFGLLANIKADLQTPFATSPVFKTVKCSQECAHIAVILEED